MKHTHYLYSVFLFSTIFLLFLGNPFTASAQEARETVTELNKEKHPGFEIVYPHDIKTVQAALLENLKKDGISTKKRGKTITCMAVNNSDISDKKLDLYFQTKKKNKNATLVQMFISKGYDNFIGTAYDSLIAKNALVYLNQLKSEVDIYAFQQKINEDEKALTKAQDKAQKLKDQKEKIVTTLNDQTDKLKTASGKNVQKAQKSIKKANKKLAKSQKKINKAEKEVHRLENELSDIKEKLSNISID